MNDISERLKLEEETENKGVCTKEWERHDSRGTRAIESWPLPAAL